MGSDMTLWPESEICQLKVKVDLIPDAHGTIIVKLDNGILFTNPVQMARGHSAIYRRQNHLLC